MKKKITLLILITIIIFFFFLNSYLKIEYNSDILSFLSNKNELTLEERQWLEENSPLIYAADNNAPPLRFVNKYNESYQGVVVDYIRALSIELGVEIVAKPLVWNDALNELEKGNTDLCDMYPSEERSKKYLFSDPIYYQRGILVVKNDSIDSLDKLNNKKIAIQKGDFIEEFLNNEIENIDYVYTDDYYQSLKLLANNKVDATAGDEPVMSYFIDELGIKNAVNIVNEPLYEKPSILAMPKDSKILQSIINKGISRLNARNIMPDIQQKWFGISTPIVQNKSTEILKLFIEFILVLLVIVLISFYYFNIEMKKRIDEGVQEINKVKNDLEITFDSLNHLLVVINEDRIIININKSFCDMLGKSKDELIYTSVKRYDFFNNNSFEAILEKSFINSGVFKKEIDYNNKIYEITSTSLVGKGKFSNRSLLILEDVTEERKRDKRMIHANKMAALGQLAAGVTHEIRNPLGIIRHNIYLIKNGLIENDEEYNEIINDMENSVESANNFIDNLLNFSRITDESIDKINVSSVINDILYIKRRILNKQNIKIQFECDNEYFVCFNKESLKHIFLNLFNNAIQAIGENGNIYIKCEKQNDYIKIKFKDDGSGIEQKNIKKIFDPFFTTKYPDKGTGLGLNIVYKEIEKYGGEINVNSEINEYTEFIIKLPIEE